MRRVAQPDLLTAGMQYHAGSGLLHHRIAGVQWMQSFCIHVDADQVLITPGAQVATQTSLIALTRPGDTILAERLTWPGLRATAAPLGLNLPGVEMDEVGMCSDALEAACRAHKPKAAYIRRPCTTRRPASCPTAAAAKSPTSLTGAASI
ncbi:MAG: hypothetical protein VW268_13445 [Rhodospirillaceae bacterium]